MSSLDIVRTENVLVRVMPLEKDATTEWHYHTEVRDFFVCLNGVITVEKRHPDEKITLRSGQTTEVIPPQVHRVANSYDGKSEYLLVQGVGAYDFVKVDGTDLIS